jgi:hypothetical protein
MTEQAREKNGEFAGNGHAAEQQARERKRYVVTAHAQRSVGTQTGKHVLGNLGKALLGVAAGATGAFIKSAMRGQGRGRR